MERLLRETRVPAGLLVNGRALRLLSAPRGESSGWLDFQVADMTQTAGRPISTALRLLLSEQRLLALPRAQRLAALLENSRKFQNEVSERLAEQVLHALYELLRGFQAAHDTSKGELLRRPLAEHPDEIYRALLTVILRLVFLLYAEEREMLPEDETFLRYYSLAGLHERLREDAVLFPDTIDQRYGAWAQLLVLFRIVFDGANSDGLQLPPRRGVLFDPDRFPFLEGRAAAAALQDGGRIEVPLVPDGTVYRALENLLVLDGERISYRALDVEQIGSVYETMIGFRLERATGRSLAIRAQKKHGAPTTVDLEALLAEDAATRRKQIQERTDRKLTDTANRAVKEATGLEDLHAALSPVVDKNATPDLVPAGAMVLQPSEERRRSGSHYTPRELTEPIVSGALRPVLERLGQAPRPEEILDLKVCDPAMGSGAFLVEACRQLGDALVEAWRAHDEMPAIPPEEDELIFARRLVAQRCLYGVDRNPMAVDLAKVSLWLATLAKDHPLTFLAHALRHGDSLVGLTQKQIEALHWHPGKPRFQEGFETMRVRERTAEIARLRQQIRDADQDIPDRELRDLWDQTQTELDQVRLLGDLPLAAFFQGTRPREREQLRNRLADTVVNGTQDQHRDRLQQWRSAEPPLAPFHWETEFPEVFDRANPGFDAIVGNPPFAGKNTTASANGPRYPDWLKQAHEESHGNADLVAHFFRRAFDLLRDGGAFGLIATNTIAQGDTRATRFALDLPEPGRDLPGPRTPQMARTSSRRRQRHPHPQNRQQDTSARCEAPRRRTGGDDHRVPVPPRRPRRPRPARHKRRQELPGQHCPRYGLHLRRHGSKRSRHALSRDAAARRAEPPQPGGDPPLHRRQGAQHESHARPPPLRHQLRRTRRRRMPATLAGTDGDRRRKSETGAHEGQPEGPAGTLVAVWRPATCALYRDRGAGAGASHQLRSDAASCSRVPTGQSRVCTLSCSYCFRHI